jgi:predicted house-cleaning noncanonical NTP pyrophosphatase (MazG superfamily)
MEITLTAPERFVLRETLEKAINDMLMEIANTDHRKMRDALKEREELLKTILEKLSAEVSSAA